MKEFDLETSSEIQILEKLIIDLKTLNQTYSTEFSDEIDVKKILENEVKNK